MSKRFHPLMLLLAISPVAGIALAVGVTGTLADGGWEGARAQRTSPDRGVSEGFVTDAPEKQSYGLLLCGIDHSRTLADVILYARFDLKENRAWLLQIPRDLYVDPNGATGKINGLCLPFSSSDPTERIAQTLETRLGLPVDGAAAITLAGVRTFVDSIGGVEMTVDHEINYLPGKVIPAGEQTITGEQAEWLLRCRSGYEMGDLDRLKVQKQFLFAAMASAQRLSHTEMLSLAAKNMGYVKTTIPFSDLAPLLERALTLTPDQVSIEQIPTYGETYKGLSVLCANRFRLAEALNAGVRADDPIDPWQLALVYPPEELTSAPDSPSEWEAKGPVLDFSWDFPDEDIPTIE